MPRKWSRAAAPLIKGRRIGVVQQHILPDDEVERHRVALRKSMLWASVRDSHHPSLVHRSRVIGAHVWPWPVLRPHQVGRSSGVNQEMNFFWQNGGNVSDDVTP